MTEPDPLDLSLSRIVDRSDDPGDWRALDAAAFGRPEVWGELRAALREDAHLRAALRPAAAAADAVDLPPVRQRRRRVLPAWTGWAAALLLAAGWLWSVVAPGGIAPADAAPGLALEAGEREVVRELDRVLLEARPAGGGEGFDVVYLRRVLERAHVPALYELAADEHGRPTPTAVSAARLAPAMEF